MKKIKTPEAWNIEKGNNSVIVAIVDTGVDYTHPDLKANMWISPDGSYGYDFVDNDNNPMDTHGHGTQVAGVVGAVADNGIGICGVAWKVGIMAVRVRATLEMRYDMVARGIRYAVDNGARIINLSLLHGSGNYGDMRRAIDYAYGKGALIVESAGNSNIELESEPQILHDKVTYVAGADRNDLKATSSSYGTRVDVCAPFYATTVGLNGTYVRERGGTSYSAPYVAGLAGLLLSHYPALTNDQLRQCVRAAADNIDALNPRYSGKLGAGRINVYRALTEAVPVTVTTTITESGTTRVTTITTSIPEFSNVKVTASFTVLTILIVMSKRAMK
jgi:subtilisin family serine protease